MPEPSEISQLELSRLDVTLCILSLSESATCAEFAFFCSGLSHEDIGDHSERGPLKAGAARVRGLGIDSDGLTGFPESRQAKQGNMGGDVKRAARARDTCLAAAMRG